MTTSDEGMGDSDSVADFVRGDLVLIQGLAARPELNGTRAHVLRFYSEAGRWAVQPEEGGADPIKLKPPNLRRAFPTAVVAARPRSDHSLHAHLAQCMATQSYAVVDDFLEEDASKEFCSLLAEQKSSLDLGDVAGGRAAAAYARITKQVPPRGDLMKFLTVEEASCLSALKPAFAALDAAVAALQQAPELADEWVIAADDRAGSSIAPPTTSAGPLDVSEADGNGQHGQHDPVRLAVPASVMTQRLQRDEMQITCYPGGGARYVKHVDNNDGRKSGRRVTCIVYGNSAWRPGDGGELRLHLPGEQFLGIDIPPKANRLVLFWSDSRVPHEVLPTQIDRYALSVWYSAT